ncbi:hypothetical protein PHLGIDRAFT_26436 [Phlebiopsis gigantea 11061_1 CR5-6]|uniref:Uncharacterized protein n=1 Tax=Phlebiopsis gigantea (strain 11061_1 CR5-6) TaxID=745531 RepID=A0A0C3S0Y5_PHLG1|nr:hypothetical protein PHLGIDRAFT_26436 [Phlebiopsis gigantea 11061_1 CR5-6]
MASLAYPPHSSPHSAPVQTSHVLNTKQRIRLVRSTRKLGAVLGATPQVADNEDLYSLGAPLTSFPSCSSSSSRSSTPDLSRGYKRHASVSEHPTRAQGVVYTYPPNANPPASLAVAPPTRSTSLTALPRKPSMKFRTSKDKPRALEAIPRPLVLHLAAVPKALASPAPSASSTLRVPDTPTPASTPTSPVFPSAAETRRKRMAKLTRTLGEIIPPHLVFGAGKHGGKRDGFAEDDEEEGKEYDDADLAPLAGPLSKTRPRRSMSVDFASHAPEGTLPAARSSRVWVTGNKTWRGEWNRKDIREVQQQLRSLKAR